MADGTPITGLDLTDKLVALGLIPQGLKVTRVFIDIGIEDLVKITYETYVDDEKVTDMILEAVVDSGDKLTANKTAHILKDNK